eukprot:3416563-Prymnesium_polylepis.1
MEGAGYYGVWTHRDDLNCLTASQLIEKARRVPPHHAAPRRAVRDASSGAAFSVACTRMQVMAMEDLAAAHAMVVSMEESLQPGARAASPARAASRYGVLSIERAASAPRGGAYSTNSYYARARALSPLSRTRST